MTPSFTGTGSASPLSTPTTTVSPSESSSQMPSESSSRSSAVSGSPSSTVTQSRSDPPTTSVSLSESPTPSSSPSLDIFPSSALHTAVAQLVSTNFSDPQQVVSTCGIAGVTCAAGNGTSPPQVMYVPRIFDASCALLMECAAALASLTSLQCVACIPVPLR